MSGEKNEIRIDRLAAEMAALRVRKELRRHPEYVSQRDVLEEQFYIELKPHIRQAFKEATLDFEKSVHAFLHEIEFLSGEKKGFLLDDITKAADHFCSLESETERSRFLKSLGVTNQTLSWLFSLAEVMGKEKARGLFRLLTLIKPFNTDYWVGLGRTFLDPQHVEKALFYFQFAHALDPDDANALYYLANCHALVKLPEASLNATLHQ